MIESQEAPRRSREIEEIVAPRPPVADLQLASLMLIMWGALVFAGNLGSFLLPRYAGYFWIARECGGSSRIVRDQRLRLSPGPAFAPSMSGC